MKRFLSMFLVVVLLAAAIPTTAFADRTSSITITFNAFDADRDKAFREWAGFITNFYINDYVDGNYNDLLNESITVMMDYSSSHTYRSLGFGKYEYNGYSLNYNALVLEDREKAEELLKYAYMEQLSESVQKQAAKLVLSGFDSRDTGKWLKLDAKTGTWTYSPQLEAVTKTEQNELIEATLDTAIKGIDRAVSIYKASVSLAGGETSDLSEYIWSGAKDAASNVVDHIFDYLDEELKKQLYSSMCKDIENYIISADDAAITYLRKTYVESENYSLSASNDITEQYIIFPTEVKRKVFKQAVDEVLSKYEEHKNSAGTIAKELYDNYSVLDKEELKKTDLSKKVGQIITIDIARSTMKTLLDAAKKNFYPEEKSDKTSSAKSTANTSSFDIIVDTVYDALKEAVDLVCDSYIKSINEGTTLSESFSKTFEKDWRDKVVELLKSKLANIEASEWKKFDNSSDTAHKYAAGAASSGAILEKLSEIIKDTINGDPTDKKWWELAVMFINFGLKQSPKLAVKLSKKLKIEIGDTFKKKREFVKNCIEVVNPVKWLDLGYGILQVYRKWNDAHKGNASADFEAFKAVQLWEVGSKGVQRGVAGFPSYADATDPNKTTPDFLVQKVSQILNQLNTESTCIRELLQILSTKSDLKTAVVKHFEEKGMKEDKLKQTLKQQYGYIRRLYDAWDEQQQHNFCEYFS